MKKKEPPAHGGKRKGAGRPEADRKTISAPFRVYADTAARFKKLAEINEMSPAEYFDKIFSGKSKD